MTQAYLQKEEGVGGTLAFDVTSRLWVVTGLKEGLDQGLGRDDPIEVSKLTLEHQPSSLLMIASNSCPIDMLPLIILKVYVVVCEMG